MKKWIIFGICFILCGGIIGYIMERDYEIKQVKTIQKEKKEKEELIKKIKKHYQHNVRVLKDTNLYSFKKEQYQKNGTIMKDVTLTLEERSNKSNDNPYFKIKDIDAYIYYDDVEPISERKTNDIYKNYIPYNLDIVTQHADFYEQDKKVLTLKDKTKFTVLGKTEDRYYVELNQTFMSVLKKDVIKEVEVHHTDEVNAPDIAVLNYHFFYDEEKDEKCNQIICHEKSDFMEQLNYLKYQHFFTTDMNSFSMYLDGIIQLPKNTVLITIDDGGQGVKEIAIPMLTEYQMHATVFLVTSWYLPQEYQNEYIECHSHTHDMHEAGVCDSGEQGGGLLCLDKDKIKEDLQNSRNALQGSTIIAYPFYDYNDYSIEQLKNNGFTMAFSGDSKKAYPGIDKYKISRYPVSTNWNIETFKNVVN